jgi:hypothetical protein
MEKQAAWRSRDFSSEKNLKEMLDKRLLFGIFGYVS